MHDELADCTACPASYISTDAGASECERCPADYDSKEGQSACELCVSGYHWNNVDTCRACPGGAKCLGGDYMPVPKPGYWVSYDSTNHVRRLHACVRGTCKGVDWEDATDNELACWTGTNYSTCDASELQCSEGATGILCGACMPKLTYNKFKDKCVECRSSQVRIGMQK
jgi:hypothetical protein